MSAKKPSIIIETSFVTISVVNASELESAVNQAIRLVEAAKPAPPQLSDLIVQDAMIQDKAQCMECIFDEHGTTMVIVTYPTTSRCHQGMGIVLAELKTVAERLQLPILKDFVQSRTNLGVRGKSVWLARN